MVSEAGRMTRALERALRTTRKTLACAGWNVYDRGVVEVYWVWGRGRCRLLGRHGRTCEAPNVRCKDPEARFGF